jgi:deoxyribonuclease-4
MLIGAHVSVAGGLHRAFDWVEKYHCESLQIFTKSQLQWEAKALSRRDS